MYQGLAGLPDWPRTRLRVVSVRVAEVGGEALGGAEGVANLLDRGQVAALRLRAGAGGYASRRRASRVAREKTGCSMSSGKALPCCQVLRSRGAWATRRPRWTTAARKSSQLAIAGGAASGREYG
jgi:hypothetical protein